MIQKLLISNGIIFMFSWLAIWMFGEYLEKDKKDVLTYLIGFCGILFLISLCLMPILAIADLWIG